MHHLERLYTHLAWADERVLESLRASISRVPAAMSLYAHVLSAEHVWLSRIRGEAASVGVWPQLSLDECERLSRVTLDGYLKVLTTGTPGTLTRGITYRTSAGDEFTSELEDILLHVALHGSYHRGQVAAVLRAAGDAPASTDYIVFARGSPSATSPKRL